MLASWGSTIIKAAFRFLPEPLQREDLGARRSAAHFAGRGFATDAHACEACGKTFADQEPYHTLFFDEKQDFRRSDVCVACWQKQFSEGARERKGFISYWHGIYEAPAPVARSHPEGHRRIAAAQADRAE